MKRKILRFLIRSLYEELLLNYLITMSSKFYKLADTEILVWVRTRPFLFMPQIKFYQFLRILSSVHYVLIRVDNFRVSWTTEREPWNRACKISKHCLTLETITFNLITVTFESQLSSWQLICTKSLTRYLRWSFERNFESLIPRKKRYPVWA